MPARVRGLTEAGVAFVKIGLFARNLRPKFEDALADAVAIASHVIAVCFAEDPRARHRFIVWPTWDSMA